MFKKVIIKTLAILLCVIMTVPLIPEDAFAKNSSGITILAFTSDVHNGESNIAADRLNTWLHEMRDIYDEIDAMGFGGDMGIASITGNLYWEYTLAVFDVLHANNIPMVCTTGNHELLNGDFKTTTNTVKNYFTVDAEGMAGGNYIIYCLGTDNWNNYADNYTVSQVEKLSCYLNEAGNDKPIFVVTHFPLHHYDYRTTTNAGLVIDALNAAAENGKKIVLLWGHNHTLSDPHYDEIFAPGDTLKYSSTETKKIDFYYAAAGCMSDSENGNSSSVMGKGLIVTIDDDTDMLTFTYYNANGDDVTEGGGTYVEQPVDSHILVCPSKNFTDVNPDAWYHESIDYVVENGLMVGTANDKFDPDGTTTRAMIVTILYRLDGEPSVNGTSLFDDVADNQWYTDAVIWASENSIVSGYGNGRFGPTDVITREQFAVILYRYAQFKGYDVSAGENTDILSYNDAGDVSDWAIPAIKWACGIGLMRGDNYGNLLPDNSATRAQAAALIMRFIENVI